MSAHLARKLLLAAAWFSRVPPCHGLFTQVLLGSNLDHFPFLLLLLLQINIFPVTYSLVYLCKCFYQTG